jgi:hypothetical protein
MKTTLIATLSLLTGFIYAAETSPSNQVQSAIAKLKDQPNYSWTMKLELGGMDFTPGPQSGKVGKDGIALVTQDFGGQEAKAVFKGDKVVVFVEDAWQTVANPDSTDFGDRAAMTARFLARTGTAVEEAGDLLGKTKELKTGDPGVLSGDLTEKGAKELLSFGRRRGGGTTGPEPKEAKGSIKFWLKDGALVKYQSHLQGKVAFGPDQEERDMDITRTIEIQDVGKTKLEIPEEAKKKLEAK